MKVVLSGYYGCGNAGDEAVLAAILADLYREDPQVEPVVLSQHPTYTRNLHGVAAYRRFSPRDVIRALRGADLLISGGGSLLQDVTSRRSLFYYLSIIRLARRFGVPAFVYAQGIGPLRRRGLRSLTRRVLQGAAGITVRDAASARELEQMGLDRQQVTVTADPVFGMEASAGEGLEDMWHNLWQQQGMPPPTRVIGAALRPWTPAGRDGGPGPRQVARELAAGLDRLAARRYAAVLLLPLHRDQDLGLCRRVQAELQVPAALWDTPLEPQTWPALFARLEACISLRLHGLIFTALGGTLPIAVGNDPKLAAVAAGLGLPAPLPLQALGSETLYQHGVGHLAEAESLQAEIGRRLPALQADARRTAALALACGRQRPDGAT